MIEFHDIVGLSEPIGKLIDAVRAGTGVLYEPTHIRRRAQAEADAQLIDAKGRAQAQSLAMRARHRLVVQEMRRQQNIEAIIDESIKELPNSVSSAPVDPDWTARFFLECQDVSDVKLQQIWAKLFAGEVTAPGSCSRRTLSTLQQMSHADAQKFEKVAACVWSSNSDVFVPVMNAKEKTAQVGGLDFDEALDLDALGLIHATGPLFMALRPGSVLCFDGRRHNLKRLQLQARLVSDPSDPETSQWHVYPLTRVGTELWRALKIPANSAFYQESLISIRGLALDPIF